MSERERKSRCKKFPKLDAFEFNQTCLMAYIGEERPRGPLAKPQDNLELRTFLDQKGMSIEEFEKMRNFSPEREITPPVTTSMPWLLNPALSVPSLPLPTPAMLPLLPPVIIPPGAPNAGP